MSRGRWVKPEFFKSLTMTKLNPMVRLHFIGLWTYADDEGRGTDVPQIIKGELWPMDDKVTYEVVEECQAALEKEGLIIRYASDTRPLFQIRNWHEHQAVPKPKSSVFPPPDEWKQDVPHPYRSTPVSFPEQGLPSISSSSSKSDSSRDITLPPARRDEAFETLCSVCNIDWRELPPSGRGAVNRALKEIRSVVPAEVDLPAEIRIRAKNYRNMYSHAVLTPSALAKHWAGCGGMTAPNDAPGRLLAEAAALRQREEEHNGPKFIGGGRESALGLPGSDADSPLGGEEGE